MRLFVPMLNIKRFTLLTVITLLFIGCNQNSSQEYQDISNSNYLIAQADSLSIPIDRLIEAIAEKRDTTVIRHYFIESRKAYKKIEWAVSYFLPHTANAINGPALDKLDLDENKFTPAEGFQKVEELIYPDFNFENREELLIEARKLKNAANGIHKNFEVITVSDAMVLEALKMGVFQITTLGITGFDTPESNLQFVEAQASLEGIKQFLTEKKNFKTTNTYTAIDFILTNAIAALSSNPSKETFDYLGFIVHTLDPLSQEIVAMQRELNIPFLEYNQVIKGDVGSLFQENSINLNTFLPDSTYYLTPAKVALGKKLFFDKKLSKNGNRNCASCHHPDKAFTDGLKTPLDLMGKPLDRNALSLNYAAYYHGQFWDMRSVTLESQSSDVITNTDEMHGNLKDIVAHLNEDETYVSSFKKAYHTPTPIGVIQLENALASYVRSLAIFNSRFDLYMRGDATQLTKQEQKGFNLFVGKGQCATCHFIPVFNGTISPYFRSSEQEILGVPKDIAGTALDADLGRYVFNTNLHQLKHAFKTPTLRNINESGPYMHNGVYNTLEEVMDFYNKGGGIGLGLEVENQTLPDNPLDLSNEEINDIIAFMKTLSDL